MECPKPVIKTKEALEKTKDGVVVVTVDNTTARDNVLRLAESMNLKAEVREADGNYRARDRGDAFQLGRCYPLL